MSALNEWIVREYFESLGYQVSQPCKYLVGGRAKLPEEEASLLIRHPQIKELRIPEHILWNTSDLEHIGQAVIGMYGWHGERIYPNTLEKLPEIVRFAASPALNTALKQLDTEKAAVILCLPNLPASKGLKDQLLRDLRAKGIDGVLCFRAILNELIGRIDVTRNYDKSDVLQIIRILKIYGLLQSPQLEFFTRKRSKPANKRVIRSTLIK